MSRVLVIGAAGFVGLNVVDALLAAGHDVRATRRRSTPTIFLRGRARAIPLFDASLEEPDKLARAMESCDAVLLTGAHYPRYSLDREAAIETGVRGVQNACNAALRAGVPRFVFTSSIATLDRAPAGRAADERDAAASMPEDSVYRAVKWAMEREVDDAARRGLSTVTLLPSGCVGPWDVRLGTGGILVAVVRRLLPWWTDGVVSLVDVGDVARAHVAALEGDRAPRYCIGGHAIRVRALLAAIAERFGGAIPSEELSLDDARRRADADEREAAPRRARVAVPRELVDLIATGQPISSALARRDLGIPTTPLEVALDRAHAWFVRFRYLPPLEHPQRRRHEHA